MIMSGFLTKLQYCKEGTVRHCQSKEASILWSHHELTRKLPGERDNTGNNARCTQVRNTTHAWMELDNINTSTGLPVEESIRMTEHRDKWKKYVQGVANPRIEDGYKEQNTYNVRRQWLQ